MELLNLVEVETNRGFRTFELYWGDVTKLEAKADVPAVSAFAGSYSPTPGTVFGALKESCGISVRNLSRDCEFDFRKSLGCWVARPNCDASFDRLLCVELVGGEFEIDDVLQNLFVVLSVMEMKGIKVETLALPVLGAGLQGLDAAEVIDTLLTRSLEYLDRSHMLKKVLFVEYNERRARLLDQAMNEHLRRVKVVLPKGALVEGIRKEILKNIDNAQAVAGEPGRVLFGNIRRLVESEQSRSFEIGVMSRRLVEFIVDDISGDQVQLDLGRKISRLYQFNIAGWIISYMHVLRIFGNESAHEKDISSRRPAVIDKSDLALCLFCLQRLIGFWLDYRKGVA